MRMHLKRALTVKINVRRLPFCLCCSLNGRGWIFWLSSNSWTASEVRSRLNSSQCSRAELRSPWRKHICRISYRCFIDSFWPFGTVRRFLKPFFFWGGGGVAHSLHWGTPPNSAARLDTLFWSELWFIDVLFWSKLWFIDVLFWSKLWFIDVLFWSKLWFMDILFWSKLWFMDILF